MRLRKAAAAARRYGRAQVLPANRLRFHPCARLLCAEPSIYLSIYLPASPAASPRASHPVKTRSRPDGEDRSPHHPRMEFWQSILPDARRRRRTTRPNGIKVSNVRRFCHTCSTFTPDGLAGCCPLPPGQSTGNGSASCYSVAARSNSTPCRLDHTIRFNTFHSRNARSRRRSTWSS
jgi:hypothetical protein